MRKGSIDCFFHRSRTRSVGAGGGIRTHEGLRHGITHPRFPKASIILMPSLDWVLSVARACQARPAHLVRLFDLTLVPPPEKSLISLLKYALRRFVSTEVWGPNPFSSRSAGKILL